MWSSSATYVPECIEQYDADSHIAPAPAEDRLFGQLLCDYGLEAPVIQCMRQQHVALWHAQPRQDEVARLSWTDMGPEPSGG